VLATALGPRGQRPINVAMLAVGAFACAFFGLRGIGHPWIAPAVAVIAAAMGAMFGALAEPWATAVLLAGLLAAPVGAGVAALKRPWPPVAALAGSIGLFVAIKRERKLRIFLPPLFAAAFAALGAAIGWGPNRRGAVLWRLLDVDWVLGLTLALAVPLVVLAVQRERWRRKKLEGRTPEMADEDLKRKIAKRQPEYERAAQELESGGESGGESDGGGGTVPQSE
jgi:hypothetical protein